jgi:hypothetical protein
VQDLSLDFKFHLEQLLRYVWIKENEWKEEEKVITIYKILVYFFNLKEGPMTKEKNSIVLHILLSWIL